jgi:carboxypeptidase PM20D1
MIRTTINLIGIDVPNKGNLPADTAVATYRLRIAPHDTLEEVVDHIKSVVGDEFEVTVENSSLPAPISDHTTKSFEYIKSTIKKVFPDVGVAPFILNAGTDARHFRDVCKEVYRFGGFRIDDELFKSVHNANERLPVDVFLKSIDFYVEFMKNLK